MLSVTSARARSSSSASMCALTSNNALESAPRSSMLRACLWLGLGLGAGLGLGLGSGSMLRAWLGLGLGLGAGLGLG